MRLVSPYFMNRPDLPNLDALDRSERIRVWLADMDSYLAGQDRKREEKHQRYLERVSTRGDGYLRIEQRKKRLGGFIQMTSKAVMEKIEDVQHSPSLPEPKRQDSIHFWAKWGRAENAPEHSKIADLEAKQQVWLN